MRQTYKLISNLPSKKENNSFSFLDFKEDLIENNFQYLFEQYPVAEKSLNDSNDKSKNIVSSVKEIDLGLDVGLYI